MVYIELARASQAARPSLAGPAVEAGEPFRLLRRGGCRLRLLGVRVSLVGVNFFLALDRDRLVVIGRSSRGPVI